MLTDEVSKKSISIKENGNFSIFWISAVRAAPNFGIFALGRDFCALSGGNKQRSWILKTPGKFEKS